MCDDNGWNMFIVCFRNFVIFIIIALILITAISLLSRYI
jgi:hypothetical protein